MQLFFGFVGLFNVLTLWPVAIFLNYMGWEVLEWPSGEKTWAVVAINMLITLSSDYIYVIAMLKTTPLLVTIGLSLTIPFAVLGDIITLNIEVDGQSLLGATLVLISLVAIGVEGSNWGETERICSKSRCDQDREGWKHQCCEAEGHERSFLDEDTIIVQSTGRRR
ncbi:hypothetical protein FRC03_011712 [Tulasnella sp. 419]|nr:hypothetical protein FRC03_011712 [Tulasnella sp. 419]